MKELIKYCLVGILNTLVGFGVVLLLSFLALMPELANLIGYTLGIFCSFFLNKYFTFKSKSKSHRDFLKFVFAMCIAYLINLLVLFIAYRIFHINVYLAQLFAALSYTLSGFLLSKFFVFVK
ncbi:GtrA family protein [Campylobacter sp. MIT 99-7217]|uniref:GtrA family protein n=1 Tax=Campylobacter sp. MIT 99-7217 TaxID=535091 RepID=UPI001158BFD6|nr:GtrA family protein [Campylobacter sp. MIT 99-7217]TQR29528.1 GtrA family protein [Campylobacter sp. MIT 99-7217]